MKTQTKTFANGVNVDQMNETIEHVKENPELADFQFRAETEWVNGGHSRTEIDGFYGAGQEQTSRDKPFVLEGDEPPILLGNNAGPNSVEALLHSLGACLTVGVVYNAAARGIEIDQLNLQMEGDLDLHAFLGLKEPRESRPGYEQIRVNYEVKTDAPREEVEALCEYVQKTSPVLDMLRNPVPVQVNLVE
jgi:uncharacterized OsmC-like protein